MPGEGILNLSIKLASIVKKHWPIFAIFAIWFVVFFKMNTGQTVVGYRDSAYLYYPYFQWIDEQWQQGEIPLWNPYCDLGYPVVADGTSSVFYPGKLIFFLRFLNYPTRYGIYVSLHAFWAAVAAYLLAYRFGANSVGSGVAGFSYAFGGSVLFQVTNVVFLVSASWLPIGILAAFQLFRRRKFSDILCLSVATAMMVLGGDPQMAYVLSAITVVTLGFRLIWCRKRYRNWRIWFAKLAIGTRQILTFGAIAFCLSAVQVLPTYYWSQQSLRVQEELSVATLSLEPKPRTHLHAVYEFSQPPWTLLELVLPNIYGKPFPTNSRWSDSFPGADRIWMPSIYLGLVAIAFAMGAMSLGGRANKRTWLTWIAIVFVLASFGWYGVWWAVKELLWFSGQPIDLTSENIGAQVGGVYWLMTLTLPGFDSFRYPAKLFVVSNMAISVLAGIGVSKFASRKRVAVFCVLSLLLIVVGWGWGSESISIYLNQRHWESSRNRLFGPFSDLAWRQKYIWTLIHSAAAASVVLTMFTLARFKTFSTTRLSSLLFVVLVFDLLVANFWLIPQIDSEFFRKPIEVAEKIEVMDVGERLRLIRNIEPPMRWQDEASENRLSEIVVWQRESLHPKHHLLLPHHAKIELLNSFTSIEHHLADTSRQQSIQNLWGAMVQDCLLHGVIKEQSDAALCDLSLMSKACAKFRLVDRAMDLEELSMADSLRPSKNSTIKILDFDENEFTLSVACASPAALVANILPDPGWKITATDEDGREANATRRKAGGMHLAVEVPAGKTELKFSYKPREFWVGLWISVLSWSGLIIVTGLKLAFVKI